jgi:uncharacterized RDD family membrane protein YckC
MTSLSDSTVYNIDRIGKNYPRSNWGRRLLAYLIDSLIGGLLLFVLSILLLLMIPWFMGYQSLPFLDGVPKNFFYITLIGFVVSLIWFCLYSLLRDGLGRGQSLGKRMSKLMVINTSTNKPCNLWGSILRKLPSIGIFFIGFPVIYLGGLLFLIEPIAAIVNDKGLRMGDMLAKTQVIDIEHYQVI